MHASSYNLMKDFVDKYLNKEQNLRIIDIGSYDICGSYKPLFQAANWVYQGLDIIQGPNVDIVTDPIKWGVPNDSYDVVISGQCLEHVEMPWVWIKEAERICKKGGFIVIPWACHIHRHPVDCWRILPDGMRVLMTKVADLEILYCEAPNANDTIGIARKK